ncbi:hypothetical protein [Variovorax sp. PAMC 28711]|uniref:hypothetical protein n=1 Tax=Variovorax sp. PAMC 28711 TaxID=1795631 RepID=UPI0012E7F2D1|nr:hypothetical protein [Variovorax sp. PAMC 28711]
MPSPSLSRRSLLGLLALPLLNGCSSPLPLVAAPPSQADATRILRESAEAHGLAAYRRLTDINIAYDGQWRPLIGRIQPEVTDTGFRGSSQERLMPKIGASAQAYTGAMGRKQVTWRRGSGTADDLGEVAVWFNGIRSTDAAAQQAAALVAEGYGLFLLGPLWLIDRDLPAALAGTERVDGRLCDVVEVWMSPGLGRVRSDRIALCVDRADRITRRIRFTLEGFGNTQGAVAEVDTFDHQRRFGVMWPMRSFERVVHPIALPAHDWHITGLDVNRGYSVQALTGSDFTAGAAAPAAPL